MSEELKRCPFCGGEAHLVHLEEWLPSKPDAIYGEIDTMQEVYCTECYCRTSPYPAPTAVEHWNRRIKDDGGTIAVQ